MTKEQVKILKKLGFKDTQEDGAILYHPKLSGMDCWVWKEDTFDQVISLFSRDLEKAVKKKIANWILSKPGVVG